jgi:hypothetical protein
VTTAAVLHLAGAGHGESRARSAPNRRLAGVLAESGLSRGRFAREVCATVAELGYGTVRYGHASVARWLGGTVPRRDTAQAITVVLGRALGGRVTLADIGLSPVASPGPAGEPAAGIPPSWPAQVCQVRRRLDWLAEEIASLSRHLAVIGPQPAGQGLTTSTAARNAVSGASTSP